MLLDIVTYGHPALRAKGHKADPSDPRLLALAEDMLETMREADGVGLAAQQVGMPLQLCVIDVAGASDRPSKMWVDGNAVDPAERMPLILFNPEIETSGTEEKDTEGCLSFPGIRAPIPRPPRVKVRCQLPGGEFLEFECDGLLARAVQHEFDHLQGILFIDRMGDRDKKRLAPDIQDLLDQAG